MERNPESSSAEPGKIYTVYTVPPALEFNNRVPNVELMKDEVNDVKEKGDHLFSVVKNKLKELKPIFNERRLQDRVMAFHEVKNLMKQEKADFEAFLRNATAYAGQRKSSSTVTTAYLYDELLLGLHLWNYRIQWLLSLEKEADAEKGSGRNIKEFGSREEIQRLLSSESSSSDNGQDGTHLGDSRLADNNSSAAKPKGDIWMWNPFPEHYRTLFKESFMKYLRTFDIIRRSGFEHLSLATQLIAHGREQMAYPTKTGGVVICIREEEVSSIIACALTYFYSRPPRKDVATGKDEAKAVTERIWSLLRGCFRASPSESCNDTSQHELPYPSSSNKPSTSIPEGSSHTTCFTCGRITLLGEWHPEIVLQSIDKKTEYSVACIHEELFHNLRRDWCASEDDYIASLSRCKRWDAQGGKSKATFARTVDDRFIIKEIQGTELESFLKFASKYFKHVDLSLKSKSQTCLAKMLGIYQVRRTQNGKETESYLTVTENVLYGRNVDRKYDLKGATYKRYTSELNNPESVRLDENFVEDQKGSSPMRIGDKCKQQLTCAVWNDTSFLSSMDVMDYSLLLGVDEGRRELVFGIIDYLRQYTCDKQIETWYKSSMVVPRDTLPTIISPEEYKKRFREFLSTHF